MCQIFCAGYFFIYDLDSQNFFRRPDPDQRYVYRGPEREKERRRERGPMTYIPHTLVQGRNKLGLLSRAVDFVLDHLDCNLGQTLGQQDYCLENLCLCLIFNVKRA